MAKLTPKAIESLKPGSKRQEIADGAMPGLYLVLQPSGARSWAVRYRHAGRPAKLTLGRWSGLDVEERKGKAPSASDGPFLTLAEARLKASEVLAKVESGSDPAAQRKAEKEAARAAAAMTSEATAPDKNSVEYLVGEFYKRHLKSLRRGDEARVFLDHFATRDGSKVKGRPNKENDWSKVPYRWGDRDVRTITKRDVIELLDDIVDSGRATTANRVRAYLSGFFNWAVGRDIIASSPMVGIKAPAKEQAKDRVLSDDEIRWFMAACDKTGTPWGQFGKTLLLTGQRLREVAEMPRRELQSDVWHLPASRSKNGRAHDIPLSPAVLAILEALPRLAPQKPGGSEGSAEEADKVKRVPVQEYVFSTTPGRPIAGFSKAMGAIAASMREIAAEERGEPIEIPHWTPHDLRRTCATGLARLGIAVRVTESVLNHISGTAAGVVSVYQRHDYADEKRAALNAWAACVERLVNGSGDNVVQIGEARL